MIFITLGTQDKQFVRILKIVENSIRRGYVKDEVVAQIGYTKFTSKYFKTYKFMSNSKLNNYINEADLIITHGGVGIITNALLQKKKVFAMPRLKMYKEHINDHQVQLVNRFEKLGYIRKFESFDEFIKEYENVSKFKPKFPKFDNSKMLKIITDFIG